MVRLISLLMIMAVFVGSFASTASAQAKTTSQTQVETVRAKVKKIGIGERGKVKARLINGTTHEGYVREANDDNFVIVDKQGSPHVVLYQDVREVKSRRGLSTGAKIGIGIAIGAGAVLAVLGLLIANLDD